MKKFVFCALVLSSFVATPFAADDNETLVVTAMNPRGWSTADTRPGGAVAFVIDNTSPAPTGALQLTTDATTAAKNPQYLHAASMLVGLTRPICSYYTKQNSASFVEGDASYQLVVNLCNATTGFTTFVFEPYENPAEGAVTPTVWQSWDVANGQMWSSRSGNRRHSVSGCWGRRPALLYACGPPSRFSQRRCHRLRRQYRLVQPCIQRFLNGPGAFQQHDLRLRSLQHSVERRPTARKGGCDFYLQPAEWPCTRTRASACRQRITNPL